jgi:hypothetical protein
MIKILEDHFVGLADVRGFIFEKIASSDQAILYKVSIPDTSAHFEVFKRKNTPVCIDFEKRIYSDTDFKEVYPKTKDFGVWAWCISTKEKAEKLYNELNK